HTGTQVGNFRNRERGVAAIRDLPKVDQPAFVAIHKWAQKHAAQKSKHRSIGADSQGQCNNHCQGKTFGARQGTRCELKLAQKPRDGLVHTSSPGGVSSNYSAGLKIGKYEVYSAVAVVECPFSGCRVRNRRALGAGEPWLV